MSVGIAILHSLLVEEIPFTALAENGLTEDAFLKDERKVYSYIEKHYLRHDRLPRVKTVERETKVSLGDFPDEPFAYWVDALENRRRGSLLLDAAKSIKERVTGGELEEARAKVLELLEELDLNRRDNLIVDIREVTDGVLSAHDDRRMRHEMVGVPFGIPYLDEISDGAQQGDTVAIVGPTSIGKSYLLLRMVLSAWEAGEVPVLVTMEMSAAQTARRLLALKSNISAKMIRMGQLSTLGRRKLGEVAQGFKDITDRPLHILKGSLTSTVEDLALRCRQLKPNILYVDGAYLLRTRAKFGSRWERIAETAEYLKMIAGEYNIPVIGTYQFNRKGRSRRGGGGLGDIGGSAAIEQLASIVCAMEDEEGETEEVSGRDWTTRQMKLLKLLKGREGERGSVRLLYDMQLMKIEEESVLTEE